MPDFNTVKVTNDARNPRIARLQLDRPDKLNAISSTMPNDIQRAVKFLTLMTASTSSLLNTQQRISQPRLS